MVRLENISKKFGKVEVLRGVDLEVAESGVFAILGPNGSGKTTLIKCILGMVLPDEGNITVDGTNIKKNWDYRNNIDYLPQIARFPDNITVKELINMIVDIRGLPSRDGELIELFKLTPFLDKKLGHLSGGTRQKVNIVLTFMFDNKILILDEPTAGLDPVSLIKLKDLIISEKKKGKIILLTTHIMNLVEEMADDIIFLLEGKIYFRGDVPALKEEVKEDKLEEAIAALLINNHVEDS